VAGERVTYAAVGCGGMGRRHLRGMAKLYQSSMQNMEMVAVCDPVAASAGRLADEAKDLLGARPRVYSDVETMTREMGGDLRAASVTTDSGTHHSVATKCLELGLHVMCEKPIAVTLRGAALMIDTARRVNRTLSIAENYRRDPINRLARALLTDGAIGTPRLMIETSIGGSNQMFMTPWRYQKRSASMPIDAGVHEADIIRYYMGDVRTVWGESRLHEKIRHNPHGTGPGGFYAMYQNQFPDQIEATGDDALYAMITFQSGAICQWIHDHAGHGRPMHQRVVYGSAGSLVSPGDRNGRPLVLHLDGGVTIENEAILDHAPSYRLNPLAAELWGGERVWTYSFEFNETDARIMALEYHELGTCVLTGAKPEVDGDTARRALALNYAPFEAGRLGRPVTTEEMISGRADPYQREIDVELGLLRPVAV